MMSSSLNGPFRCLHPSCSAFWSSVLSTLWPVSSKAQCCCCVCAHEGVELFRRNQLARPGFVKAMGSACYHAVLSPLTMLQQHLSVSFVMQTLCEETNGDAIITTGVGQHQMWAAQWYKYNEPRRWASSGGLGSMGFGLPSALGAAVAWDGTDSGRPKKVLSPC